MSATYDYAELRAAVATAEQWLMSGASTRVDSDIRAVIDLLADYTEATLDLNDEIEGVR